MSATIRPIHKVAMTLSVGYKLVSWTLISRCMSGNQLKLNHEKTELLNVMTPYQLRTYGLCSVVIDDVVVQPSKSVRTLGVLFDEHMSMHPQVTQVVRTCNFHLRNIGKIRRYITTDACKAAVQSLVVSRLDYCCALLHGLPQSQLRRLQLLQNTAARIITRTPYRDHITPVLADLHWLPCKLRIQFRILVYVFKCLHNEAPVYLDDLVGIYIPRRSLRSSSDTSSLVNRPSAKRVGERAFRHSAPALWNELPTNIRDIPTPQAFKRALKTFYYRLHFYPTS